MKLLVLAPGIMGSGLRSEGKTVWPPTPLEGIFGYGRIQELLDPNLEVTRIIPNVSVKSIYKTLLNDIEVCEFHENGTEKRFLPFPYDWRRSNADSAADLADKLDRELNGVDLDGVEILFLAHSMGGLVMRYLLESGDFSDRAWFGRIKWLVTLGTPHHGAPLALFRLTGKEGTAGIKGTDVRKLANDARYPSLYELISPAKTGLTSSDFAAHTLPKALDPFSSSLQTALSMNPDNVQAARAFWEKLSDGRRPDGVEYFSFVSSAHRTLVRNELLGQDDLMPIRRSESGDGTVPVASAISPQIVHGFSEKKHESIFLDRQVRRYLYKLLGAPAHIVPQSAPTSVDLDTPEALGISLNKEGYAVGEEIEIAISYNSPRENPSETFSFIEVDPDSGDPIPGGKTTDVNIRVRGIEIHNFRFLMENRFEPGMYELQTSNPVDDAEKTYLIVRDVI